MIRPLNDERPATRRWLFVLAAYVVITTGLALPGVTCPHCLRRC